MRAIFCTVSPRWRRSQIFSGTSGATPIVAGHAGLFFQMWSDGLFGNAVDPNGTVFDNRCHMATAKAVLINTARQWSFSGNSADLARVHQGWGFPSVRNIYDLRDKLVIVDESKVLSNLETAGYAVYVGPGETEFRATLVYADPPGLPAAAVARINDLSLQVITPSGEVYWGNNGLLEGNYSSPNGSSNHVDTVENVFVAAPEAGLWIVRVIAEEINEDGHVETPAVDADFALVISPAQLTSGSVGAVAMDRVSYACDADVEVRVLDDDLNTDPGQVDWVAVNITSSTDPVGESVVLWESDVDTGSFVGTIGLDITGGAGSLQISDADDLVVVYVDADDGQGGVNVPLTATAIVDCTPPTISNVRATNVDYFSAIVRLDTDEPVVSRVHFGLDCGALSRVAESTAYTQTPDVLLDGLLDAADYYFIVEAIDAAGNSTIDDNGGQCYMFTTAEYPEFVLDRLWRGDGYQTPSAVRFSPDGLSLASGHYIVFDLDLSPDGLRLASAGWSDRTARIWNVQTGATTELLTGFAGNVRTVGFSPDGSALVTASWDQALSIWRASDAVLLARFSGNNLGGMHPNWARFGPDGRSLAYGTSDGALILAWNPLDARGDCNDDGIVDVDDFAGMSVCLNGPGQQADPGCTCFDLDLNNDVSLADFAEFQRAFAGQ